LEVKPGGTLSNR